MSKCNVHELGVRLKLIASTDELEYDVQCLRRLESSQSCSTLSMALGDPVGVIAQRHPMAVCLRELGAMLKDST